MTTLHRKIQTPFWVLGAALLFGSGGMTGFALAQAPPVAMPVITESGLGPVTEKTAFRKKVLKTLFPAFSVQDGSDGFEDQSWPTLEVADEGERLFTLSSQHDENDNTDVVGGILVFSRRIRTAQGDRVSDTFTHVYRAGQRFCQEGYEQETSTVICLAPGSDHLIYQFAGDGAEDGIIPAQEILKKWKIVRITWGPGSTAAWSCRGSPPPPKECAATNSDRADHSLSLGFTAPCCGSPGVPWGRPLQT